MPVHPRTTIRNALVMRLTGLPTTGNHVFSDPVYDIEVGSLPALVVATLGEEIVTRGGGASHRLQERRMTVQIQGLVRGPAPSDVLDAIAMDVESAINADVSLGGLALDSELTGIGIEHEESDQPIARITLHYEVSYATE